MPARKLHAGRRQSSHQLTVEAWVEPAHEEQGGPARLVSYSQDPNRRNFTLGQDNRRMVFRLRTPGSGLNGTTSELRSKDLVVTSTLQHWVFSYRDGAGLLYLNGELHERGSWEDKTVSLWDRPAEFLGPELTTASWSLLMFPIGVFWFVVIARRCMETWVRVILSGAMTLGSLAAIAGVRAFALHSSLPVFEWMVLVGTSCLAVAISHGFHRLRHPAVRSCCAPDGLSRIQQKSPA